MGRKAGVSTSPESWAQSICEAACAAPRACFTASFAASANASLHYRPRLRTLLPVGKRAPVLRPMVGTRTSGTPRPRAAWRSTSPPGPRPLRSLPALPRLRPAYFPALFRDQRSAGRQTPRLEEERGAEPG